MNNDAFLQPNSVDIQEPTQEILIDGISEMGNIALANEAVGLTSKFLF